eukprot:TRINITY_DN8144_c0_g1_i1.p1 TRINITY_DN8144_c0_g1~~TRINITY_DN8144_c0_g1_i1.p1  ORF type:complete len:515 (+),score=88.47 TRINITY_DN8144_c0_g1_i1:58-1602(+)
MESLLRRWTTNENDVVVTVPESVTDECTSILARHLRQHKKPYPAFRGTERSELEARNGRDPERRVRFSAVLVEGPSEQPDTPSEPAIDVQQARNDTSDEKEEAALADTVQGGREVASLKDRNQQRRAVSYRSVYANYCNSAKCHKQEPIPSILAQLEKAIAGDTQAQRVLYLRGMTGQLERLWCLLDALEQWTDLRHMTLLDCGLSDSFVHALCMILQRRRCLQTLNIAGSPELRYPTIASIQHLLQALPLLTTLDLSGMELRPRAADLLGKGIAQSAVETLTVNRCQLGQPSSLAALVRPLARSRLRHLSMQANRLNTTHKQALAHLKAIKGNFWLDLAHNYFGDTDPCALALCTASWRCQLTLDLSRNHISSRSKGSDGVAMLCHASSVHHLILANNDLSGTAMAESLKKALAGNSHLCKLNLRECNISDEGMIALAEALSENNSLEMVNLRRNPIGTAGLVALRATMVYNKSLRTVFIDRPLEHEDDEDRTSLIDQLMDEVNDALDRPTDA